MSVNEPRKIERAKMERFLQKLYFFSQKLYQQFVFIFRNRDKIKYG